MPNALSRMMVPRPATPEHLRLKLPATLSNRSNGIVGSSHLKASTTEALTFMYRSVIEEGHAMQIVDFPSPCWVRKRAATPAEAALYWKVGLAKFDKSQFRDQPFSISVRASVPALQDQPSSPKSPSKEAGQSGEVRVLASLQVCRLCSAGPRGL
jgi:hypothetical protein